MYYYSVYGFTVESEFELFGVRSAKKAPADVTVEKKALQRPAEDAFDRGRFTRANLHEAFMSWEKVGSVQVNNGHSISVCPIDGIPDELISLFITGAAMGVLLHQRGYLVLHASGVSMNSRVAAFVGLKGMGKSTTAAALVGRGHDLVSDDVVAVDGDYLVRPGTEVVKLWPTALEAALQDDPAAIPKIYPEIEKRARLIEDRLVSTSAPLSAVYVLDAGEEISIEPVSHAQAFMEVVRHSYAPRFVGTDGTPPEHFDQCTRFVSDIPLFRLKRRPDLNELSEVAAAVESHFDGL